MSSIDNSHPPVYIHKIYNRETGEYLYYRRSYYDTPDQEYLDLVKWAGEVRRAHSDWICSVPPGKARAERLAAPMPKELDWEYSIIGIRPRMPYANDGSRRKKSLQRRLAQKSPLFAEELFEREVEDNEDYFSGNAECDHIKAAAREELTDEYWDARFWADLERCVIRSARADNGDQSEEERTA